LEAVFNASILLCITRIWRSIQSKREPFISRKGRNLKAQNFQKR
jgi:hypothetical protein